MTNLETNRGAEEPIQLFEAQGLSQLYELEGITMSVKKIMSMDRQTFEAEKKRLESSRETNRRALMGLINTLMRRLRGND